MLRYTMIEHSGRDAVWEPYPGCAPSSHAGTGCPLPRSQSTYRTPPLLASSKGLKQSPLRAQ